MKLIKINLSEKQNEWIDRMMGSVSFEEYGSESMAHDRDMSPEEVENMTKAFDQVSHDEDNRVFVFPRIKDDLGGVYSEILSGLDRLLDTMEDDKTGTDEMNDRAIFSDQQSIRALIRKVEAAWEGTN